MQRPSFLVLMTDQHRADHLGCYGNPTLRTPNIDRLAAHGAAFDGCYVATPICMPNRASFMTSRMPSLHGVRHNGIGLSLGEVTFTELLRAEGYATALIGKSHLQNMEDDPPALRARVPEGRKPVAGLTEARRGDLRRPEYAQELPSTWADPAHRIRTPYYGFDHVELCDEHGDLAFGDYERWLAARDREGCYRRGPEGALAAPVAAPQAWRTSLPAELYPTSYIGERTQAWLEDHARTSGSRPFFLLCSFPDPHHPFTPPGKYWGMYDPHEVELPPSFHHARADMPPPLAWLHAERAAGKSPRHAHRAFAIGEDEARQAIALTYGMISLVDDTVGGIMAALERADLADSTIVLFMSDHGDFMGDHGLLLKGPLHYRGLIRTPLIWSEPARAAARRTDALVSIIDIPETILARAGIASPNGAQGRSLLGLISGAESAVRNELLIEDEGQRAMLGFKEPVRVRTLLADGLRLSLYLEGEGGELYDWTRDPHELRNLWSDPAYAQRKARMLERLARAMMEHVDRSPLPTGLA